MKNKIIPIIFVFIFTFIACALTFLVIRKKNYIDISFATEIVLKYHYNDIKIDKVITDKNDIKILKENFKGVAYKDNPSCGFSMDISITFTDGENNIIFCPACDSCSKARVGDTKKYINIKNRELVETIIGKYGMIFPCV